MYNDYSPKKMSKPKKIQINDQDYYIAVYYIENV